MEKHNGPEKWKEDGEWWYCDSRIRAKALAKRLETYPTQLAEARKRICTRAVTTADTMQQMVFQPASGYSRVWVRG